MISARHLVCVRDAAQVLNEVSISVDAGACIGIDAVPSGTASTLFRVMAGLEEPQSGTVHLSANPKAADAITLRRAVKYVSACTTRPGIGLNVGEYLQFLVHVRPSIRVSRMTTRDAASCVGLGLSALVSSLTDSERAALSMASCLVVPKDVVLIDYALDAIDDSRRNDVIAALIGARDTGIAMMIASHDHVVLDALCHRTVALRQGRVDTSAARNTEHDMPVAMAEGV